MKTREVSITSNAGFLAAVYVDGRYSCLLDAHQATLAQKHLLYLAQRMSSVSRSDQTSGDDDDDSDAPETDRDPIELLLKRHDKGNAARPTCDIRDDMKKLCESPRLPKNTDIFQWWDSQQHSELREVAKVAIALPVSQASVERTFSGLRYILSERRLRMTGEIIDAIMILRCNT